VRIRISKGKRGFEGFSLVELMFVLLLLGLILSLTFPNFRQFVGVRGTKGAVMGLIGSLRYAQSQAATTKRRHQLNVDIKENAFWITLEGPPGEFFRDPTSHGQPAFLPKGLIFLDVQHPEKGKIREGTVTVDFFPTGWVDGFTFHLQKNGEEAFTVFLQPLGGKVEVAAGYLERMKG